MALPKRRHSRTRQKKRRTHYRLQRITTTECPNCGNPKMPHRICSHCGHYKGREVLTIADKG